jgi:hypothetical protein
LRRHGQARTGNRHDARAYAAGWAERMRCLLPARHSDTDAISSADSVLSRRSSMPCGP